MKEDFVEMYDIYTRTDSGGTMIEFPSGKHLKLIARIVNGQVLVLGEDYFLEKRPLTKKEADLLLTNKPN